jgi:hypothetical protein
MKQIIDKYSKLRLASIVGVVFFALGLVLGNSLHFFTYKIDSTNNASDTNEVLDAKSKTSQVALVPLPAQKLLLSDYYVPQTFNNCGPAALSMDFSYFGLSVDQETIADDVRPTHNLTGMNDDKSTMPDQIVAEGEKYGMVGYFRPGGSITLLKQFIAAGIPIIVRTQFSLGDDFAHYRVIKGYEDATSTSAVAGNGQTGGQMDGQTGGQIIQEDGYQGKDVRFSYADFMTLWKPYNYQYMIIVPPAKQKLVEAILASSNSLDDKTAWINAAQADKKALLQNPSDAVAGFDLSVALYYTGEYQQSVAEFQNMSAHLSPHLLWYQIEPIESYAALGSAQQVFALTNAILSHGDPVFPSLYVLQGQMYAKEGNIAAARSAFEQALFYNKNFASAQAGLSALLGLSVLNSSGSVNSSSSMDSPDKS